jgi:hypothetical protein
MTGWCGVASAGHRLVTAGPHGHPRPGTIPGRPRRHRPELRNQTQQRLTCRACGAAASTLGVTGQGDKRKRTRSSSAQELATPLGSVAWAA